MTFEATDSADNKKEISITFVIPENDFLYKDFITCCVYEPHITISAWKTQTHSTSYYDPSFKDTKQIFSETFTLSLVATQKEYKAGIIHLYCSYYRSSEKKLNHAIFTFSFPEPIKKTAEPYEIGEDITTTPIRLSLYQPSYIDMYATKLLTCVHKTVAHAQKYYLHYFFLLILCIIALFLVSHYLQKKIQSHTFFIESTRISASLLLTIAMACLLAYCSTISSASVIIICSCMCAFGNGIFYIKKSTEIQTEYLRTFCMCIGNLFIYVALFLLFKGSQY